MQETWKDIKGYEGIYKVSNLGNILSLNYHRMKITKLKKFTLNHKGYPTVHLSNNKNNKRFLVHRLVAEAFIPNPNNYPQINHIDGNKQNNKIDNLEWCTNSENIKHAYKNKLIKIKKGAEVHNHRKVNQYDLNGNLVNQWTCINDASRKINKAPSGIIFCCQGRYKTAYGFIWKYNDKFT